MRRQATDHEQLVWRTVCGRRKLYKFGRQYPIGTYVLDFYCEALKLAIEVDGESHDENAAYDASRSAELAGYGITVVRVSNRDTQCRDVTISDVIDWAIEEAAVRCGLAERWR